MAILAILRAIVLILTMMIYLMVYAISRLVWKHTTESAFKLRKHWISYVCLPILNVKIDVKGGPINKASLYVCNHRSFLDPAIISKYLNAMVIAKAEIADYPIISKGAEVTGVIWVRRDSKDSRVGVRQAYIDTIKNGVNVLVFPEGTVSIGPKPLPFKMGTFAEAAKNNFTVIPMALEYKQSSDIWTTGNLIKYYIEQASKWSIHSKLTFGPPLKSKDGAELHEKAESWIRLEMKNQQKDWSTAFDIK